MSAHGLWTRLPEKTLGGRFCVLRLGRLSGPTSRRCTTCSPCSLSRNEAKREALIWPMGTHNAFTRAGAMGSRESALIVLRAFLHGVALLVCGISRGTQEAERGGGVGRSPASSSSSIMRAVMCSQYAKYVQYSTGTLTTDCYEYYGTGNNRGSQAVDVVVCSTAGIGMCPTHLARPTPVPQRSTRDKGLTAAWSERCAINR